jgi:hypothetical protein
MWCACAGVEKGIFARHGLDVRVAFTENSEKQRAGLAAGTFDIAHSAVDRTLRALAEPSRGFTPDAAFDMQGFRNLLAGEVCRSLLLRPRPEARQAAVKRRIASRVLRPFCCSAITSHSSARGISSFSAHDAE